MRLEVKRCGNVHSELVAAVGWNAENELYSCGDDKQIARWNANGDAGGKVCDLDAFVTAMHFSPAPADGPAGAAAACAFAAACSDGTLRFFLRNGRVERTVEAHAGAVTSVRWTKDGACALTAGEDGAVKSWSPSGRLRGVVAAGETAVYAAAWSPEAHASGGEAGCVVVARGKNLRMHASNAFAREGDARAGAGPAETQKLTERPGEGDAGRLPAWRAHDGVVLAVDWCAVSGRLVSGGEDRKYKVWDAHGRALFSCAERDHAITSVAWSPSGEHFAAGAYDAVWLCDGAGWSRATTSNTALGSTLGLSWSGDGRTVAGACAKAPGVFVGTVVDVERACDECVARLAKPRAITIRDAKAKSASRDATIETRDRVGAFSFEHGHLLLGMGTKVLVYERGKWGAPKASAELGGVATFLAQSRDGFAAAAAGVSGFVARCFSYDGRKTCDVPFAAARTSASLLSPTHGTFSLAPECACLVRRADATRVVFLDLDKAGAAFATLRHAMPVAAARLSRDGAFEHRAVAFLDENRDLFVARVAAVKGTAFRDEEKDDGKTGKTGLTEKKMQNGAVKIAGGVDAFAWSASGDGLVAASRGGEVTAWHCASAFFVDPDLVPYTRSVTETPARGQGVVVERFDGNRATIRGGDGAVATTSVSASTSAFFPALHAHCAEKQWDRAIRLCRFVRDDALWATLATRAMAVDELESASIAYAALEAIEKVQFVEKARAMPSVARRGAELRAFRREHEEAERILLGAGLVFRAVELNLRLLDWDRALALALEHRTHIDTVLHVRAAHLRRGGRREDKPAFVAAAREVEVSEEQVRAKIARERERENALPAREETARAGAKDRNRAAPKAKPSAAKAPTGARTGSTRR